MSQTSEETSREIASVDTNLTQLVSKAELDQQITTALANPRSVKKFRAKCLDLATLTEQIADECIFALPRKEGGQTKMIEGPSVRLAEIVAHSWGNCRAAARVVEEGREFITAQGVFHDLETNTCITYEVRRRITGKYGRYNADMISTTGNAACAIALRNAVFKGVPKAFWNDIYEAARKVTMGDAKTLANRRSEAMAYFQKLGASADKVFATLGVAGIEEVTLEHLAVLVGLKNAIKDGELTIEEAFKPKDSEQTSGGKTPSRAEQAKAALAGQDKVPHFDLATATAALKEAKTVDVLEAKWKEVVADYANTGRALPIELEAARNDHREALNQKGK
jgi:hypothetical protein